MNRLRTHIARLVTVLLVCSGFSLSFVQPTQAKHSNNAFADWLSTMTTSANTADLQQELDNLRKSDEHLDKIIEKASHIVSQNNEDFVFSMVESMASAQLYRLLLVEWNQFQTGNDMSCVPVQKTIKLLIPAKTDFPSFTKMSCLVSNGVQQAFTQVELLPQDDFPFPLAIIPMVEGIAIGAP